MRKLFITFLAILFAVMMIAPAQAQLVDADTILAISKIAFPPTIDGVQDCVWTYVPRTLMMNIVDGTDVNVYDWYDWTSWFKAAYDDNNFYVFLWSADDELWDDTADETGGGNAWEDDSYEIYFDGDYSHTCGGYDGLDDMQLRFPWNGDALRISTAGPAGIAEASETWPFEQVEFENISGWSFEVALPLADIYLDPEPGLVFGFEVDGNDDDADVDARDSKSKWWADNDLAWNNPCEFGTAQLTSRVADEILDVTLASKMIVVDGIMEDTWKAAPWIAGNFFNHSGWGFPDNFDDWYDLRVDWKIMWDDDGITWFVQVWDDMLVDGESNDWQDDSIEIYMDADNSKQTTYDGIDDSQIRINWSSTDIGLVTSTNVWTAEDFELGAVETDMGWDVEIKLPFAVMDMPGGEGWEFGTEVDYNDDDDGEGRDMKLKSVQHTSDDNTWSNPSVMGTAVLVAGGAAVESHSTSIVTDYALSQNYPNPFNPSTTITYAVPKTSKVLLTVYDMLGKEIATLVNQIKPAGEYNVTFNGADLASGVYFYKLETDAQVFTNKMMLIK